MAFQLKCPHCHKLITERDFAEDTESLNFLQNYFDGQKAKYLQQIKQEWSQNQEAQFHQRLKAELTQQESDLKQKFQEEIKKLNEQVIAFKLEAKNQKEAFNLQLKNVKTETELATKKIYEKQQSDLITIKEKNWGDKEKQLVEKIENLQEKNENLLKTNTDLHIKLASKKAIQSKVVGENFEAFIEQELKKIFPQDDSGKINKAKGYNNTKADFFLDVKNEAGTVAGKIVFEVKAGTQWKDSWIGKFKEDMYNEKTDYGILIAPSYAEKYPDVAYEQVGNNLFITSLEWWPFIVNCLRWVLIHTLTISENSNLTAKNASILLQSITDLKRNFLDNILPDILKSLKKISDEANGLDKIKANILKQCDQLVNKYLAQLQVDFQKLER